MIKYNKDKDKIKRLCLEKEEEFMNNVGEESSEEDENEEDEKGIKSFKNNILENGNIKNIRKRRLSKLENVQPPTDPFKNLLQMAQIKFMGSLMETSNSNSNNSNLTITQQDLMNLEFRLEERIKKMKTEIKDEILQEINLKK